MGVKEKTTRNLNGCVCDTINDQYYRAALINFLSSNYRIDGLIRVSNGNSHDASWESEVMIFNNGGLWHDELNLYRTKQGETYFKEPIIIDKKEITDDLIDSWSDTFDLTGDGEYERLIFCSYNDNSARFCFSIEQHFFVGRSTSNILSDFKKTSEIGHKHYGLYLKRKK